MLAWAFELTPEGVVRAEDVVPDKSIARKTGWKLTVVIVLVGVLATALFAFQFVRTQATSAVQGGRATISDKSIAVLPFENRSEEKDNAFFADGIQDDVLTSLAKIHDLKVISRTSVMAYRDTAGRNLREIGQALGVVNILEGSVRRIADRVLIHVRLTDSRNARQIWAERYDRTLADSLTLQGECATEIATALRARLSPEKKRASKRSPP